MLRVSSIDSSNMLLIFSYSSSWETTIPSSSELATNGMLTAASTYAVCCASSGAAFPAVAFPFDEGIASRRSRFEFGVTKYVGAQNVPNSVCQVLLSDG
ncbi:unnamed protein product [Parnassius apollo]|uniref:(apollo) hypothetical protein n=1 Tax=Parnassius apollo TaxID=110799 RepID=A0A8S3Y3Z0_PARAO|nr:unnamed protein product [Parnassius apollo]